MVAFALKRGEIALTPPASGHWGLEMDFTRLRTLRVVILPVAIGMVAVSGVSAQETTPELLAAQIRDQGYHCAKAVSAQRDKARSKPDEAVWLLQCDTHTYRIRLIPDMAARVKRLK
jgi:hypothetical protein